MDPAEIGRWFEERLREVDTSVGQSNRLTSIELLGIARIFAVDLHRIADALTKLADRAPPHADD